MSKYELIKEKFLKGLPVIVFDHKKRENEADFIFPAEITTPELVNFVLTFGKGLLCVAIEEKRQKQLKLDLLKPKTENSSLHGTNFTMPVDLLGFGCTTGISASDRAKTICGLSNLKLNEKDFARPGHIFPLVADKGGLKARQGHTEATIEIVKRAGFLACGLLIEILDEEGEIADKEYCFNLAKKFDLEILEIPDLY